MSSSVSSEHKIEETPWFSEVVSLHSLPAGTRELIGLGNRGPIWAAPSFMVPPHPEPSFPTAHLYTPFISREQFNLLQPPALLRDNMWASASLTSVSLLVKSLPSRSEPSPPPPSPFSNLPWIRTVIRSMWARCTCERYISLPFITAGGCTMPPILSLAVSHTLSHSLNKR